MKLIEQVCLWNREGSADKVYEVDLCEVGTNQYVVNFRYGRRGATLKDGTKTTLPVALTDGQRIFNQLVGEKKKGGYQEASRFAEGQNPVAAPVTQSAGAANAFSGDKPAFVLAALQEAIKPGWSQKKWPLSRIIWRVGELRIKEAAPMLIPLLMKGDALQQYCVCWALGRCGDTNAIQMLEQIYGAAATKEYVKRMALTSQLALESNPDQRKALVDHWLQHLATFLEKTPTSRDRNSSQGGGFSAFWKRTTRQTVTSSPNEPPKTDPVLDRIAGNLRQAILTGSGKAVTDVLKPVLGKEITYSILESFYLFSTDVPPLRPVVLAFLTNIPFGPNGFKTVRQLFKTAEFREDAEVFAQLARRFEKEKPYFNFRYSREYGVYDKDWNYIQNPVQELQKPNSQLAYSNLTAGYFTRRAWRTLQTLGEDEQDAYISLASAVLLSYNDPADHTASRLVQSDSYQYDNAQRTWVQHTRLAQYDTYANYLTFNHILYQNSPRYEYKKNNRAWRCKNNYKPGDPIPEQREEAFPALWDKHPQTLIYLLQKSENERVHEFAARALRGRTDLKELVTLEVLVEMLSKPYEGTIKLGLELVKHFYDPQKPNLDLVRLLIHSPSTQARRIAREWIEARPGYFLEKTAIFVDLIVNPYEEVWDWTRRLLSSIPGNRENAQVLTIRLLAELLSLPAENELANQAAEGASQTMITFLLPVLRELEVNVLQDLLRHPLPAVQTLGATILLHHTLPPEQLPAGLLSSLVQSTVPGVRQAGVQLFGKLPEATLLASRELLVAFCVSPFTEIRKAIGPTIASLADKHPGFGQSLLAELLAYLRHKEAYEGLHQDLYHLLTTSLRQFLPGIDRETVLTMLHQGKGTAQQLGAFLLLQHTDPATLSIRQIVSLASHETLAIRQFSWQTYTQQAARMRYEAEESLRMLDAKWEDSRQFAFDFFRNHFSAADWTPTLLIMVCDSTRPDVQQFGRELITKFFRAENGERFLLQLSQHPTQQVQIFATNYLEQFASDQLSNIEQLEPYFVTVLSQVNKSGVAKTRIFRFLHGQALKHEKVAQLITDIMARQSVTMAVADKAACIAIMRDLKKKYPTLPMPLVLKEFETRSKNSDVRREIQDVR